MTKREERILGWIRMGKTEEDMKKWDEMVKATNEATKGKKRIFDPFVGYIER